MKARQNVFVPYRGIYFLYDLLHGSIGGDILFSSPIGESTFSTMTKKEMKELLNEVFVPYRGIYFLYYYPMTAFRQVDITFSSPIGESTFSTALFICLSM